MPLPIASMRSNIASIRNCSGSTPPSSLIIELRRKPVATTWSCVASGQQVAGDLLDDELVVGQVAVEGADDPVAIEPDLARLVLLVAVGIGITRGIEPEPSPALAVMRRVEQPVDELGVGVGAACRPRRRRPRRCVGGRPIRSRLSRRIRVTRSASGDGRQPLLLEPGQDERIDRVAHQAGFLTAGIAGRTGGTNAQCR